MSLKKVLASNRLLVDLGSLVMTLIVLAIFSPFTHRGY